MTTTTELHAAIAQMQVLMREAADRIEENKNSLAESSSLNGIIKDLEVQAAVESDTLLIAHLRAAALPWDQRHKPAAQEPIGYVSEDHGGVIWKGIMPPFGARLTMQADVPEAKFGDMAAPAQEPVDTQKPAQQGQSIDIAFLRQVLSVAIAGLFEHHKDDVLRVFTQGELQAVVDLTEPLRPQQVEDIYKRAWVMLTTPKAQPAPQPEYDALRCAVGNCTFNGEVAVHAPNCPQPAQQQQPAATVAEVHMSRYTIEWTNGPLPEGTELYTSPQAQRKPLTEGATVIAYQIGNGADPIKVERAAQVNGAYLWAVRQGGNVLSTYGEWEYEPTPSGRDADFIKRCRFATADAAIEAAHKEQP